MGTGETGAEERTASTFGASAFGLYGESPAKIEFPRVAHARSRENGRTGDFQNAELSSKWHRLRGASALRAREGFGKPRTSTGFLRDTCSEWRLRSSPGEHPVIIFLEGFSSFGEMGVEFEEARRARGRMKTNLSGGLFLFTDFQAFLPDKTSPAAGLRGGSRSLVSL